MSRKQTNPHILAVLATAACFAGSVLLSRKTLVVFPSPDTRPFQVTDSSDDGGRSRILDFRVADGNLAMVYRLEPGFARPYAGVGLAWKDSRRCPDLGDYGEMAVTLRSSAATGYIVALRAHQPDEGRADSGLGKTGEAWPMSTQDLPSGPALRTHVLPLDGFTMPLGWEDRHRPSAEERKAHLRSACRVHLISARHLPVGGLDTLELAGWRLEGRDPWIFWGGLLLPLTAWSALLFRRYRLLRGRKRDQGRSGRGPGGLSRTGGTRRAELLPSGKEA